MTHRPTFHTAVGKRTFNHTENHIVSIKDQLGQKVLKFRQFGQGSKEEISARDYKTELEVKEQEHLLEQNKNLLLIASSTKKNKSATDTRLLTDIQPISAEELRKKYDDADADNGDSDRDLDSSDEEDDESDEDDEMELQRELVRIKAERAAAQAKKDQEVKDLEDKKNTENALKGNPLVNMGDIETAKVKRRWNDDVVFRNQARDEPEHKKRFINDTIRNDFHRQFLKKFMK